MPTITTNTAANTALRYLNINSAEQNDNLAKIADNPERLSAGQLNASVGLAAGD